MQTYTYVSKGKSKLMEKRAVLVHERGCHCKGDTCQHLFQ